MYDNKNAEFTPEMYKFIGKELKITKEEIETNNSYELYDDMFEKLFDIECWEIPSEGNITQRGENAADILTLISDKTEYTDNEEE